MRSKKILLNGARLYLILDREVHDYGRLLAIAQEAVAAGVDIIQLRDKSGTARDILTFSAELKSLTKDRVLYIINDRADLALAAGADGVHLGQDDLPVGEARRLTGDGFLIGVSCQTIDHARQAAEAGADYIGFGSVFKTLTKPGRQPMDLSVLRQVCEEAAVPVFPIGGIDGTNISLLSEMNIDRAAVCRTVCRAKDVGEAVKTLKVRLVGNKDLMRA